MSLLKRILSNRKVVFSLLAFYFLLASWIGGPWFALFTGGLAALAAGFMWWLSRDKSTQQLGSSVLLTGFVVAGAGLWIGNTPTILPDSALPYEPILAKPTAPLIPAILPAAGPESALPSPSPSPGAPSSSPTSPQPVGPGAADAPNTETVVATRPAPVYDPSSTGGVVQPSSAVTETVPWGSPTPGQPTAGTGTPPTPTPDVSVSQEPPPSVDPAPTTSDPSVTSPPSSGPEPTPEPTEVTSEPGIPTDLPTQTEPPPADPDPVRSDSAAPWSPEPSPEAG